VIKRYVIHTQCVVSILVRFSARPVTRLFQGATQSVIPTLVKDVVARFVGVIFEPEQEAFFELATERLPDRGHQAQLEAGNPPRNGATRNFE
jgi:hypothetical protein